MRAEVGVIGLFQDITQLSIPLPRPYSRRTPGRSLVVIDECSTLSPFQGERGKETILRVPPILRLDGALVVGRIPSMASASMCVASAVSVVPRFAFAETLRVQFSELSRDRICLQVVREFDGELLQLPEAKDE